MARLHFRYGAMGSSKTATALMTRFNYLEKGRSVWLIKPATDTRDGETVLKSRIGVSAIAETIERDDNIREKMIERTDELSVFGKGSKPQVIIVDECQFLTKEQVDQLRNIASYDNVPVLCFGLRTNFKSEMFEGSKRLFEVADNISELQSICRCGEKATVNARITKEGKIITEGDEIEIGGNDKYESLCWRCWRECVKHGYSVFSDDLYNIEVDESEDDRENIWNFSEE